MDLLSSLTTQLVEKLISENSQKQFNSMTKGAEFSRTKLRADYTSRLGLIDVAKGEGSFAHMVAYHEKMPEVIIKIVPKYDHFLIFARLVMLGRIKSRHFPKVYSITKVDDSYVVMVENIPFSVKEGTKSQIDRFWEQREEMQYPKDCSPSSVSKAGYIIKEMAYDYDTRTDLHSGNFRRRKNGTIVVIDPVWNPKRHREPSFDAYEHAEKIERKLAA